MPEVPRVETPKNYVASGWICRSAHTHTHAPVGARTQQTRNRAKQNKTKRKVPDWEFASKTLSNRQEKRGHQCKGLRGQEPSTAQNNLEQDGRSKGKNRDRQKNGPRSSSDSKGEKGKKKTEKRKKPSRKGAKSTYSAGRQVKDEGEEHEDKEAIPKPANRTNTVDDKHGKGNRRKEKPSLNRR